ncbi:hypothetical protein SY89_01353 [Halolamina pelagica]|uniref:DUF2797 domain-containing protein n=1 Tax=Halolamina pelagica TaxID=699431 RepID=A0A0P7FUX4_9EURY|nr:DUF2797 domain-containing protein [Halolamina pelagica]KPN30617.1 hypothetical protein SY89_01353 [Halolamina pelagica]
MQFVGYDAGDGGLLLARDGDVEYVDLTPGTEIAYQLGERHCAGVVEEGGHTACDADGAPYCDAHSHVWVCAKCTGECLKDEMDCFEDHAVYLAAFAPDVFKVGVTREWRLETRLLEQGADRAAHVRTVDDGRAARRIEAGIAERIPDRVRMPTKIDGLGRSVADDAWEALLADFDPIETFEFDYGLDLDGRPVTETMATGTVRGVKGRILLLERAGSTYAVDLRSLVGYEVSEGPSEREMQSSLGAFG